MSSSTLGGTSTAGSARATKKPRLRNGRTPVLRELVTAAMTGAIITSPEVEAADDLSRPSPFWPARR